MSDESLEIIETIRDRRDRAVYAHGRTAAAMDVMHLSPFEQAVYVDAALNNIDRLTAERDQAREQLAKLRAACEGVPEYMEYEIDDTIDGGSGSIERDWIAKQREWITRIRAALGIESEADHE